MKKLLVVLVVGLLGSLWPAAASAFTPAFDREWAISPEVFVDEVAFEIPKGQGRRMWRTARDRVLLAYSSVGLDVIVVEAGAVARPTTTEDANGLQMIVQDPATIPQGQIVVHVTEPEGTAYGVVNHPADPTAGVLSVPFAFTRTDKTKAVRIRPRHISAVLAHEVGHVLGLDHTDDPTSVMSRTNHVFLPSADDLAALVGPEAGLPDPGDSGYRG